MKNKIKNLRLKFYKRFWRMLPAIAGFAGAGLLAACNSGNGPVAMYGVPVPDMDEVKFFGKVFSEDSLKPIPGIEIKLHVHPSDTIKTYSSAGGTYQASQFVYDRQSVRLIATDKDGPQHGKFEQKSLDVEVNFRDLNNGERYQDIFLKRKP